MDDTLLEQNYDTIISECINIFLSKTADYGPTWMLFRDESFVDQLWIKAKRIRTLEGADINLVNESSEDEYLGIINYAVIMLMKLKNPNVFPSSDEVVSDNSLYQAFSIDDAKKIYSETFNEIKMLMKRKNHDYGAAWTQMHIHSITDQIIIKIFRIKNIISNGGKLIMSEGIDAQLSDIINYSIFGLMKFRYDI